MSSGSGAHPVSFWQGVSPPGTLFHWIEWGASFLRGDCLIVLQASASGLTCTGVCVTLARGLHFRKLQAFLTQNLEHKEC